VTTAASGREGDAIVILARHGRTELNARGVLRGHLDPPLDAVGLAEAAALGRAVGALLAPRHPVRIVTSPLHRAVQTASAIAAAAPAPVDAHPGLIDRDYGRWAGKSRESVEERFGRVDAAPGVEAAGRVIERALHVLESQRPLLAAGPVVLVAHDVVNRLLLTRLDPSLGPPDQIGQRTACWNLLTLMDGTWRVRLVDRKEPID
jgi:probable phosphoglycerate mutase